jgi:maleylacetate reductase
MSSPDATASPPLRFSHDTMGQRVVFGSGLVISRLDEEVRRLGASRVMLIAEDRLSSITRELAR